MKKLSILALLISGLSLTAGEPSSMIRPEGFSFKQTKRAERNILKVNSSFMREEDRESHGPGLFANIGLFMPSESYLNPDVELYEQVFGMGYTAEVGNYFRFFHTDRFGVGLRATWVQLGYLTVLSDYKEWIKGNFWISPLRVGPQLSVLATEDIGIDLYYQLGVHYSMFWYDAGDKNENSSFAGIGQEAGLGLRWKMFTLGAGLKFGSIKHVDDSEEDEKVEDDEKYPTSGFRVFLGIAL